MRDATRNERPVEVKGHRFIKLKSGRMFSFWDAIQEIESAHTTLARAVSRAFKLATHDYDLERLEDRVEFLEEHLRAIREHLDKQRGNVTKRQRIALLRNTTGRTPEEAEAFRRKADKLERELEP